MENKSRRLTVAITGASGSIYAVEFLKTVSVFYDHIYLIVSKNAEIVMRNELNDDIYDGNLNLNYINPDRKAHIEICNPDDLCAPPSSGSVLTDGMVIVPCSMGTSGRIASGISDDLITRAADVCLKERRKLILAVRETPLSLVHLRNLTTLTEAGAVILPASPGFYHNPKTIDDLAAFVVARIMQQLGLAQGLVDEWGSNPK